MALEIQLISDPSHHCLHCAFLPIRPLLFQSKMWWGLNWTATKKRSLYNPSFTEQRGRGGTGITFLLCFLPATSCSFGKLETGFPSFQQLMGK